MILSVFITVITGHDKPQPPGCLLESVEQCDQTSKKHKVFPTSEAVKKGGFDNLGRITEMDNTALLSSLVTAMTVTFEQRNLP